MIIEKNVTSVPHQLVTDNNHKQMRVCIILFEIAVRASYSVSYKSHIRLTSFGVRIVSISC